MNYPLLISTASTIIAASAFMVALLNYRTSRKLSNENKLFEEKFRSYRSIIAAMNTVAAVFVECANSFEELKRSKQKSTEDKADMDNELAKAYYLLEDTIHEQMLVLPDEILERIDDYLDLFNQEDFLEEISTNKKIDDFEEQLNDAFDNIINVMREDLAIDKLDTGLRSRIGSRRIKRTSSDERV